MKLILTNDNKVLFVQVVVPTAGSLKGIFAGLGRTAGLLISGMFREESGLPLKVRSFC